MARQKKFQLWLTDDEYNFLKSIADKKSVPMGEILRDYIKDLAKKSTHGG
ncbi:hypothetical protein G7B40_041570 [Aetokthonos hydrillicola Thurmond2011]|jgi:hypothetical protein|uniref:Uncharacterized protein n=1 Tax=Aetokthonos hydrillicola Thurmond2011 TaxID=2712845 RepID=A0AAP5IG18_9CYAN|nr:hypothetical protein [Aetokthonos hydrillicola]MBO3461318.1 hypothetical protein [Aetokthonos hydrillicola CCALA 1050]MBW4589285.1 hypothetical protein [Aetokthonos hydrillicola CCALA 1050]MDR9900946.1 hypothetical protein [Aetokthonos hydrillicola Thurmond2011]